MNKLMMIAVSGIFALTACVASEKNVASNTHQLELHFTNPAWNGENIPTGQQCRRFGGIEPKTPALEIKKIPPKANAIIIEFSDKSYAPMDNGGHGKIGYVIDQGIETVVIPSIPGHTFDLPKRFFVVAAHQAPDWDDAGAYLPPCSGGNGNIYYATVKAIYRAHSKDQKSVLLAESVINMGRY